MMQNMPDYQTICNRISDLGMFGEKPGSELMPKLLSAVDHPEKELQFIHIAGTNGKGSVAYYTAAILRQFGMKVGLYTSPHILRMTERIRMNGGEISREDFARIGDVVFAEGEGLDLTASDVLLAMALIYFNEQEADVVIMETGLGGRYDSTAAVDESVAATVTAFTRIALDHTALLGDDLLSIAREKAGILRENTFAVIAPNDEEVTSFMKGECEKMGVLYHCVADDKKVEEFVEEHFPKLALTYQKENLMTAIAVAGQWVVEAHSMENDFFDNDDFAWRLLLTPSFSSAVTRGMDDVRIPERLTLVMERPPVICDAAHNPFGVKALGDSIRALYPRYRFVGIAGMLSDKDYEGMARVAAEWLDGVCIVPIEAGGRTPDVKKIEKAFCDYDVEILDKETLERKLLEGYGVVAFGSFYLFGELIDGFSDTFGSIDGAGFK